MSLFSKLFGTTQTQFQIGGPSAPSIVSSAGALQATAADGLTPVTVTGANPTLDQHFATKAYVDSTATKPLPCAQQFNGNSALPSNSGTEQWYVVTTSGSYATIGEILWDDGLNTGTVTVLPAVVGQSILTEFAFTGGTVVLPAQVLCVWSGSEWVNIIPSVSGAVYQLVTAIGTAASQSSATSIPAGAWVTEVQLVVINAFSAGTTITVGQNGSTSLLLGTSDSVPTVADAYGSELAVAWGSSVLPVLVTVAGTPSTGAGNVVVSYCVPNA